MQIKPGDWVRFDRNYRLEIAVVEYVYPKEWVRDEFSLMTDRGPLSSSQVVEVRHVPKPQSDEEDDS